MDAVTMPDGCSNVAVTVNCTSLQEPLGAARKPMAQRAACDRCRGQKLRCPRMKPGSRTVCDRCQRIGAVCRTAPRLPSGRPSLRSRDAPGRRPCLKDTSPNSLTSETLNSLERKDRDSATSDASPSPSNTPSTEASSSQNDMYDDKALAGMPPDDSSIFGDYQSLPFGFDDMIEAPDDRTTCFDFDFVEPSTPRMRNFGAGVRDSLRIPSPSETYASTASSVDSVDVRPLMNQDVASSLGMVQVLNSGNRDFIDCVSGISERATSLLRLQWNDWAPSFIECTLLGECTHEQQTSGMVTRSGSWRLPAAFELMTDFVRLWRITCQRFPSIATSTKPALGLAETLMLLATCIQIGQLLEMLISSIRKASQTLSDTFETSPITSLYWNAQSGCHSWQHNAYLMMQIIENHCSFLVQCMSLFEYPARLGEADSGVAYQSSIDWLSSPLVSALTDQLRNTLDGLTEDIELAKQETFRC